MVAKEDDGMSVESRSRHESGMDDHSLSSSSSETAGETASNDVSHHLGGAPVLLYRNLDSYTELDYPVSRSVDEDQDPVRYLRTKYKFQFRWSYADPAWISKTDKPANQEKDDNEKSAEKDDNEENSEKDDNEENAEKDRIEENEENQSKEGSNRTNQQEQQSSTSSVSSAKKVEKKKQKFTKEDYDEFFADSDESDEEHEGDVTNGVGLDKHVDKPGFRKDALRSHRLQETVLRRTDRLDPKSFSRLQQARWTVMSEHSLDYVDRMKIIRETSRYERKYMPLTQRNIGGRLREALTKSQLEHATMAIRQRNIYSDPAYLAMPAKSEITDGFSLRTKTASKTNTTLSHRDTAVPFDVQDAVSNCVGSCIACFSCFCRACMQDPLRANQWLLHPVGSLLERIRLSHLQFPNERKDMNSLRSNVDNISAMEFDAGSRVWQLTRCEKSTFVARTEATCITFEVVIPVTSSNEDNEHLCSGGFTYLKVLHRLDFRNETPPCVPRWCVGHPGYERPYTDPKMAILCKSQASGHQNVVKHANVGLDHVRMSHSTIANLQTIGQIDFSKQHPMVLWSSARSFVRPSSGQSLLKNNAPLGHGFSLYNMDLRTNKATFQWSPSHHEHQVEGVYSVSAVKTVWSRDHSLLVSSINAKKTWEIDTRMPCRVLNTWSLPHMGDQGMGNGEIPFWGSEGVGFLLSSGPLNGDATMLGVNSSPGSFGIHLYRRPHHRPLLQTDAIEAADVGTSVCSRGMSIASSSSFTLADVSDDVFTCGLDSLRVATSILGNEVSSRFSSASTCLCVMTATSKGDVYLHNLLESSGTGFENQESCNSTLPIGAKAVYLPRIAHQSSESISANSQMRAVKKGLRLELSNEFPVPSSAVMLSEYHEGNLLKRKLPNGQVPILSKRTMAAATRTAEKREIVASLREIGCGLPLERSAGAAPTALAKQDPSVEEQKGDATVPEQLVEPMKDSLMTTIDACFETPEHGDNLGQRSDISNQLFSQLQDDWDEDEE